MPANAMLYCLVHLFFFFFNFYELHFSLSWIFRYLSEQERQKELARLRRELRKAEREEKFGAAAMVLGLAERNAEMEKR